MAHLACTCSCGGKHEERLTGCKTRQAAAYPAELVDAVTCVLAWSGLGGEAVPGKCPAWLSKLLAKDSSRGRPKVNFAARRSDEGKPAASGVGLGACQSAVPSPLRSEAVRVGTYTYPEPLQVVEMGRGYYCVVPVTVGQVRFRATLDTGAARNLIRAEFAEQLRKSAKTRDAVVSG